MPDIDTIDDEDPDVWFLEAQRRIEEAAREAAEDVAVKWWSTTTSWPTDDAMERLAQVVRERVPAQHNGVLTADATPDEARSALVDAMHWGAPDDASSEAGIDIAEDVIESMPW